MGWNRARLGLGIQLGVVLPESVSIGRESIEIAHNLPPECNTISLKKQAIRFPDPRRVGFLRRSGPVAESF